MAKRRDELLRDLARLFIKYGRDQWEDVIVLLRTGGPDHAQIAAAIEEVQAKSRSTAKRAPIPRRSKGSGATLTQILPQDIADSPRGRVLTQVLSALRARQLLPSMASIKDVYTKLGGKGVLPSKREAALPFLVRHLAGLSEPALADALKVLSQHRENEADVLKNDYSRWFRLIYEGTDAAPE